MEVLTSERKNFHRANRHADAKDDAGEHLLRLALAVSEHQTADDDGDQAETLGNRAGEGGLENVHGVVPRVAAGLCVDRQCGEEHQRRNGPSPALRAQSPEVRPPDGKGGLHLSAPFVFPASGDSPWKRLERR